MTIYSGAIHGTFTIERSYQASPSRVFEAWADPAIKARWFIGPESWTLIRRAQEFRVGGEEILHGKFASGAETLYVGRFHAIKRNRRLVFSCDMHYEGSHLSVSLATVELEGKGAGTHLRFTKQAVFLDGKDGTLSRERGTAAHLDRLGEALKATA